MPNRTPVSTASSATKSSGTQASAVIDTAPSDTAPTGTGLIDAALASADLRVLVMCLFHMTGDKKWIEPPFQPRRDVRLVADPAAGFSSETQDEIRASAKRWLTDPSKAVSAIDDPGFEQFGELLSVFLGEPVPEEYVPLTRQDMGFDVAASSESDGPKKVGAHKVLIIGAGVSGVCLAAEFEQLGIDYEVIESNPDVGGTWLENRYPGCGVDTPNHFYSYSFAPNPDWEHFFSPASELLRYVDNCATEFGVRDRMVFNTKVVGARWDDDALHWIVTTRDGDGKETTRTASVLVSATGHFNQPAAVSFPDQEQYEGRIVHATRWPQDLDLTGLKVAIIGTGATAMQLVPTIVSDVESLTIFQRTPQWARPIPEYNLPVDPSSHWLFASVPYYDRWYRFAQFWRYGDGLLRFLRKDEDWEYPERSLNRTNDRHRQEMTEYIETKLASRPDLIAQCVPTYPPFGKRMLIDNGWFDALLEPHVELVTDAIEGFTATGARTSTGTLHDVDVVIMATGFNVTNLAARIEIEGIEGHLLSEDWADENPTANIGMTVPGFPNFFVMYGPNTNMGHGGSGMWMAETQTHYIAECLRKMAEEGVASINCQPDVRDAYTERIDSLHEELVWTHPGTSTYYRNRHGKVRSPMPFRLVDYWTMTRTPNFGEFKVVARVGSSDTEVV